VIIKQVDLNVSKYPPDTIIALTLGDYSASSPPNPSVSYPYCPKMDSLMDNDKRRKKV
jgi:hypothetical protein